MATYRELVYLVIDLAKLISDDSTLNENHIVYLLDRYRTYLLEQKYKNNNYSVPINNAQEFCSNVKLIPLHGSCGDCGDNCEGSDDAFLYKTVNAIPNLLNVGSPIASFIKYNSCKTYGLTLTTNWTRARVDTINNFFGENILDYSIVGTDDPKRIYSDTCQTELEEIIAILSQDKYDLGLDGLEYGFVITTTQRTDCEDIEGIKVRGYNNVTMVSKERFPYVGTSKYMKNKIYGTLNSDHHIYLKSAKENFYDDTDLQRVLFLNGVFESPMDALKNSCSSGISDPESGKDCIEGNGYNKCEPLDNTFFIEDSLITQLLALVLNSIRQNVYNPNDKLNNANDDLSSIENFVRAYMKDKYVKGNEGKYEAE